MDPDHQKETLHRPCRWPRFTYQQKSNPFSLPYLRYLLHWLLHISGFEPKRPKLHDCPKWKIGDEDEDKVMCSPRSGAQASTWNLSSTHSPAPPHPPPPNSTSSSSKSTPYYILSPSTILAQIICKDLLICFDLFLFIFNLHQGLKVAQMVKCRPNVDKVAQTAQMTPGWPKTVHSGPNSPTCTGWPKVTQIA